MNIEEQGITLRPQKAWPITRATQFAGIAQLPVLNDQRVAVADGGAVSKADQLMADMAAKYGVSGQAPAAPVQQPASQSQPKVQPQPQQQGIMGGIIGTLKGRQQQIDKAAGYRNGGRPGGGIIRGPGTPTSDSIDAAVKETGEPIKVSTEERIVSKEQGKFLESVARNAGYDSLDAMLEDGTGKPVGPTIKAGKRAAADGMSRELDPFAYRGGQSFGAAGPVNGPDSTVLTPVSPGAIQGIAQLAPHQRISAAIGAADQGAAAVAKPEARQTVGTHGAAKTAENAGIAAPLIGRNDQGIITADSAKAAMVEPMQRSGGIFGTYDGKGVNAILERENKARGEMIDSMIQANGGNGIAVLPELAAPSVGGDPLTEGLEMVRRGVGNRTQAGLAQKLIDAGVAMRGQDQREGLARDGILGNRPRLTNPLVDELTKEKIQGTQLRNERTGRLNDIQQQLLEETDPEKQAAISGQIRALSGKTQPRPADQLNLPQRRTNAEITAARLAVAGLTPEEIKRKTANFTATGRENPEYDPTLAKAVSTAGRRMYGTDDEFDQRQQAQQPAGNDGDVMTRFRADAGMKGHKLGQQTEQGVEVLDASGKLIGHYR